MRTDNSQIDGGSSVGKSCLPLCPRTASSKIACGCLGSGGGDDRIGGEKGGNHEPLPSALALGLLLSFQFFSCLHILFRASIRQISTPAKASASHAVTVPLWKTLASQPFSATGGSDWCCSSPCSLNVGHGCGTGHGCGSGHGEDRGQVAHPSPRYPDIQGNDQYSILC